MTKPQSSEPRAASPSRFFSQKLLAWYDRNKRDLPWRSDRDPYRIWLSEIMLQQTRVSAAVDYYRRFLTRFPTVHVLASARSASVLAAWSGLGYYRRASALHAAAKQIVRDQAGEFPKTAEAWQRLPGIGRYTAAAIASIALGEPVAVVDGNVERVLQRLSGTILSKQAQWAYAGALLSHERPGDFNQALMELGATTCLPRNPSCASCPVSPWCATRSEMALDSHMPPSPGVIPKPGAFSSGARDLARCLKQSGLRSANKHQDVKTARLSVALPPREIRHKHEVHYAFDVRGSTVFLVQRPKGSSLMPEMWELPEITNINGPHKPYLTLKHSITVTDYTVRVLRGRAPRGTPGRPVSVTRVSALPLTGLTRKILRAARVIQ